MALENLDLVITKFIIVVAGPRHSPRIEGDEAGMDGAEIADQHFGRSSAAYHQRGGRLTAVKRRLSLPTLALVLGTVAVAQEVPKGGVFLGFTYTRMNSATNVPAFSANGAGGQFAINANKWLGFVADLGAVHNGNIGGNHLDTTLTNFLFGPRVTLHRSRVIPYIQTLFGGVYGSTSIPFTVPPGTVVVPPTVNPLSATSTNVANAVATRVSSSQTAFALVAGGGIDIKISRHLSFRPIGLDYYLTRLQNLRSANDNNQNNIRYTTGFNFTFGGEAPTPPPPPPPALQTCWDGSSIPASSECPKRNFGLALAATQTEVCPGDTVAIKPSMGMPADASYQWSIQGQPISQAHILDFGATGREPGAYKVDLTTTAPGYNDSSASTTVNVLPYRPPTATLEASPAEVWLGEQSTLAMRFTPGQCGGTVRPPVLSASEGVIRGNMFDSTGVQFDPSEGAEQRKNVRVLAKVTDAQGSVDAEATVVVKKRPAVAKRLPDIVFPQGQARVNNCGKRVLLEELKAYTAANPAGKVVLVGHTAEKEASGLDQRRALNAAAVISAGKGICQNFPASQVLVSAVGSADNGTDYQSYFCGSSTIAPAEELAGQTVKQTDTDAKFRRVEVWFVPSGGVPPESLKDFKDAASLSVGGLGCPR